ncbi:MAG: DNA phosphorothioation system sulfurtransferase DndC [Nannocystaceae bacterium]
MILRKENDRDYLTPGLLKELQQQVRDVYRADARPWVIGYSGGKDSTATLQLIWYALASLPREQRLKPIYVIASDTLVETPVIVDYIQETLTKIDSAAQKAEMPFRAHKVTPAPENRFWFNMIGKGYPAPYRRFRWCTDRLKIDPANRFINERVNEHGEVVLVLGVRRSESSTRAQVMSLHRKPGDLLSRHTTLRSAWVYTPVEHFSTNDVWTYLFAAPSPWGNNNRDLLTMYRNAQAGECPLVVDTSTPSCGNSRFGCWVCTVVEHDRSMEAMIDSGQEWMQPLLDLRDWLTETRNPDQKHKYRDLRRRNGRIQRWGEGDKKVIWGPYKLDVRKEILRRLLEAQMAVRRDGPDKEAVLIFEDELHDIRRIWRTEEGDWQDSLPRIYEEVTGESLAWVEEDAAGSSSMDNAVLEAVCKREGLPAGLLRELIDLERDLQGLGRRSNVYERIDSILGKDWSDQESILREILANRDSIGDETDEGFSDDAA